MSEVNIVSLADYRGRAQRRPCRCSDEFVCYPHRLLELTVRVEDLRADVDRFQFCDLRTFERLSDDVLSVLASITEECLPAGPPDADDHPTTRPTRPTQPSERTSEHVAGIRRGLRNDHHEGEETP